MDITPISYRAYLLHKYPKTGPGPPPELDLVQVLPLRDRERLFPSSRTTTISLDRPHIP